MKANELRIGNFLGYLEVDLDTGQEAIKHYPCTLNDIHEIQRGNVCNKFSPIPITEDWLLNFGFEFLKCGQDVNSGDFCHWDFWIKKNIYIRGLLGRYGYETRRRDGFIVKYVHQLQNLYFALTGEELTLKEK